MTELYIVRHGETEWSKSGQYTSITDLELTPHGRECAAALKGPLSEVDFDLVLSSPRTRALQTAELAGFPDPDVNEDLVEWFYGDFEGLTSQEIDQRRPGWVLWKDSAPGGEILTEIETRLRRVIDEVRQHDNVLIFAHGHILRALTLMWLNIPLSYGGSFPVETSTVSVLGDYKGRPALKRWNSKP